MFLKNQQKRFIESNKARTQQKSALQMACRKIISFSFRVPYLEDKVLC